MEYLSCEDLAELTHTDRHTEATTSPSFVHMWGGKQECLPSMSNIHRLTLAVVKLILCKS